MTDATVERFELDSGTEAEIRRPSNWNGYVVVQPDLWDSEADQLWESWLSEQGFASVRHSRLKRGWDLVAAGRDERDARQRFEAMFGRPERGYVAIGGSLGGLTVRWLLEREEHGYLGAIAMDGGGAGAISPFERGLDATYALTRLLDLDTPLNAPRGADPQQIAAAVIAAATAALAEPDQCAYIDVAVALAMIPAWSDPNSPRPKSDAQRRDARRLAVLGSLPMAYEIRAQVEQSLGGAFCGNRDVSYARMLDAAEESTALDEALNRAGDSLKGVSRRLDAGPRVAADPELADRAAGGYPIAGTIDVPLVVLRTIGDPHAVAAEESHYNDLVTASGRRDLLRTAWVDGPGHVNSSVGERAGALRGLITRVEEGVWHTTTPTDWRELTLHTVEASALDLTVTRWPIAEPEGPPRARFVDYTPSMLLRDA